jgi:multidrug efflux system membrane fusion protein
LSNKNLVALIIGLTMAIWLFSGSLSGDHVIAQEGGQVEPTEGLFKVRAMQSQASQRINALEVSGQTEANRIVTVRAEVAGRIEKMNVQKGDLVKIGDVLCQIAVDTRQTDFDEARASFKSAEIEYKGLMDLRNQGLQSEVMLAKSEAALATSQANLKRTELALQKTRVVAPFNGVVEMQPVEQGDYLNVGQSCVTVMEIDPILVRGQIAERSVNQVELGREVAVTLITGETLQGQITYIARSPDSTTRTFPLEVTVFSPGESIRAGISARMQVPLGSQLAHLITPAAMVLNDSGQMGVRIVEADGSVAFKQVSVVGESTEGVWVKGLPDQINLITVGQEEVFEGQKVEVDLTPLSAIVGS